MKAVSVRKRFRNIFTNTRKPYYRGLYRQRMIRLMHQAQRQAMVVTDT